MKRTLLLFLVLLSAAAHAQAPRKKVVLALSGGGAYGMLYLGALEWMERHRIPVDAIAGTSGGALVGGWYATGLELLTDDEILRPREPQNMAELRLGQVAPILSQIDYEHLFDSQPDYRNLTMLQKRERRQYPNDFFGGLSDSRTLRRDGLVPGQTVGYFLDWIGRDYPLDFEDLPIPFRAVAVDSTNPDPSRWHSTTLGGPKPEIALGLSRAIRASIAVPLLFAPVEAEGRRLIDGAVLNNLPTDAAIDAFNPDVLIGFRFDNGNGPDPYRKGTGGREAREKLLITFDPENYHVDQFSKWREFAWLGYQEMARHEAELKAYSLSPEEYLAYRNARRARHPAFDRRPTRVEGDAGTKGRLAGVRRAVLGRSLDDLAVTRDLGRALDQLVADEGLATAGYDLRPGGLLYVRTTRHPGGHTFLRAGLDLEQNSGDRLWYGLRGRISDLRPNRTTYFADLTLGNTPGFTGGVEVPIGRGLTLAPSFRLDRQIQFDFGNGGRRAEASIATAEAGLAVTYRPNRNFEASLGVLSGANGAGPRYGGSLGIETGAYRTVYTRAEWDSTDDPVVPRIGTRAWLDGRAYNGLDRPLVQASGAVESHFGPRGDAWSVRAGFGTSFGDRAPFPFDFRLGGLGLLDAYRRDEIRDDGYLLLGLSQTHALVPLPFAFGRLFTLARVDNAWASGRSYSSASLGLLADTRLGAGYFGLGLAEHGALRLLIGLGRRF